MAKQKFIINKNPLYERCPDCKKPGTLHRSRPRNLKENLFKTLSFWNIYRCNNCGWRGIRSHFTITSQSFKTLLYYILIILIASYIVKFIIGRIG